MIKIKPIEVETKIIQSDLETQQLRWSICSSCEFYSVNENVDIGKEYCSACNCILLNKILNQQSQCPKGKW